MLPDFTTALPNSFLLMLCSMYVCVNEFVRHISEDEGQVSLCIPPLSTAGFAVAQYDYTTLVWI